VLRETHAKELASLEQDRVRVLDEHSATATPWAARSRRFKKPANLKSSVSYEA
jgi:hypothetical protein